MTIDGTKQRWYDSGMKIKTSITLSEELLKVIDEMVDTPKSRSQFLETAAWAYIAKLRRAQLNQRDLEIINRRAEYLNAEVSDALSYQVTL
jgi:metal-responsive CopG/Arc/MetJ family transcriptional regulator